MTPAEKFTYIIQRLESKNDFIIYSKAKVNTRISTESAPQNGLLKCIELINMKSKILSTVKSV